MSFDAAWVFGDSLRELSAQALAEGIESLGTLPKLASNIVECKASLSAGVTPVVRLPHVPGQECALFSRASVITSPNAARKTWLITILCDADSELMTLLQAGDALGVQCANEPAIVESIIARLELESDAMFTFKLAQNAEIAENNVLPNRLCESSDPVSVQTLFESWLDVCAFPKKAFLRAMAEHTSSDIERCALLVLASRKGSRIYMELAQHHATLIDFLNAFPSCRPPFALLVNHLGLLHPRFYSVCRLRREDREVDIVFSATRFDAGPPGASERRSGVCSAFIERACAERACPRLCVFLRSQPPPPLRMPERRDVPVVFVCAGTGISPFIGFLDEERLAVSNGMPRRTIWLVYGFRRTDEDCLFLDDIASFVSDGTLARFVPVASRERVPERKYVQHALEYELADDLRAFWSADPPGAVVICGDELGMVRDVNAALVRIIQHVHSVSEREAQATLVKWTTEGRVIRDVWI